MKLFSMIVAVAVVVSVTACEYKEQRIVQQPGPRQPRWWQRQRPRVLSFIRRQLRRRRPSIADPPFLSEARAKSLASP